MRRLLCQAVLWAVLAVPSVAQPVGRHALLVGISQYNHGKPSDFWDLHTSNDIRALKDVLEHKFSFPAQDVHLLESPRDTTHAAFVAAFRKYLIQPCQAGDVVYFHYSGHGSQIPDPEGDQLDGLDSCLVPSDYVSKNDPSNNIRGRELGGLLEELKARHPSSITVTLDSCFSGGGTRGRELSRGLGYSGPRPAARGKTAPGPSGFLPFSQGYAVLSATRHDQVAKETEDEQHHPMGLLSYALVKSLWDSGPDTTYRDLFDRVNDKMSERNHDQSPQLEGDVDKVLLKGLALKSERYLMIHQEGSGLAVNAGTLQGITVGSEFALYPPGTKTFKEKPIARARVQEVDATRALLSLTADSPKLASSELRAARAVETRHEFGDQRLHVDVSGAPALDLRDFPLVSLEPSAPWDVKIDAQGSSFNLMRQDGTSIVQGACDIYAVRKALEGEARWRTLKTLCNKDPESLIGVELRLVNVEVELSGTGKLRRVVKDRPLARAQGQQLALKEGEWIQIEVRNPGVKDAYVTILDLREDGNIGPVWPHPLRNVQENKVAADGVWHRIPFPFVFRVEAPYGREVFKAIATEEAADFSPLLTTTRGPRSAPTSPLGQLLRRALSGQRAALGSIDPANWATAAVQFQVLP